MDYCLLSKQGDRDHNEDYVSCKILDNRACFVLADGLGGHDKGEVASEFVVNSILNDFETAIGKFNLKEALTKAQTGLLAKQNESNATNEMKTTVVVLVYEDGIIQWGHVGDSRLYLWKKHRIVHRTKDHSVPQMLVASGKIKEKDIRNHVDRNRLLKVMGSEWNHFAADLSKQMRVNRRYGCLLCSDGFWEHIDEKQMKTCLWKASDSNEWLSRMEEIVLENGANRDMDNYSAIVVWFDERN